MIDLGLPSGTKWACCNVGASKPEDYGGYYEWGKWGLIADAPTDAQQVELKHYCTSVWTTLNGVNGRLFTGPNGGQIFLPAAGYCWDGVFRHVGSSGDYWSCTPYEHYGYDDGAYHLYFSSSSVDWSSSFRMDSCSVRRVAR